MTRRLASWPALLLATLTALLMSGAVAVVGSPSAAAHDVLVSTSPKDGSTVASTPDKVMLTFDHPAIATGTEIHVKGPAGEVQTGKPVLVDSTVSQAVQPGAAAGHYTVTWRITSADGHPISGTFAFTSSTKGAGAPATSAPSEQGATSAASAAQAPTTSNGPPDPHAKSLFTSKAGAIIILVLLVAGIVLALALRSGRPTVADPRHRDSDDD